MLRRKTDPEVVPRAGTWIETDLDKEDTYYYFSRSPCGNVD